MNKLQLCIFPGKITKNVFISLTDDVLQELLYFFGRSMSQRKNTSRPFRIVLNIQLQKLLGEKLKYPSVHLETVGVVEQLNSKIEEEIVIL